MVSENYYAMEKLKRKIKTAAVVLATGLAAWFGTKTIQKNMEKDDTQKDRVTLTSKPETEHKKLKKVIVEETIVEEDDSNQQQWYNAEEAQAIQQGAYTQPAPTYVPEQPVAYTQPAPAPTYVQPEPQPQVVYTQPAPTVVQQPVVQTVPAAQTVIVHDNSAVVDAVVGTAMDLALMSAHHHHHMPPSPHMMHGGVHHAPRMMPSAPQRTCRPAMEHHDRPQHIERPHHERVQRTHCERPHVERTHIEKHVKVKTPCGTTHIEKRGMKTTHYKVNETLKHASSKGATVRKNSFNRALKSASHSGGMKARTGASHGTRNRSGSRKGGRH